MMRHGMIALLAVAGLASATLAQPIAGLRYIGQHQLAGGAQFGGTTIGGLSGIDFDPSSGTYYAISDDRSAVNPARFYNLNINFDQNTFSGVSFNSVTTMLRPDGSAFPLNQVDPESIRFDRSTGKFLWTSEGERVIGATNDLQNPFVREMNANGSFSRQFATPARYNPTTGNAGIRRNLAFESVTISPSGSTVYTATENALLQDGPGTTTTNGSNCRVLSFNKATGAAGAEYVYQADPVAAAPVPADQFFTSGLVEMLAISETEFLTVERSFSIGVGYSVRIYKSSIAGATDVSAFDALPGTFTPMSKELLFNLDTIGITLDNIEGISLGPVLPNGSRSVVVVADNNFTPGLFTQFIAFEVVPAPATGGMLLAAGLLASRRRR